MAALSYSLIQQRLCLPAWASRGGLVTIDSEFEGFQNRNSFLNGVSNFDFPVADLVTFGVQAGFLWTPSMLTGKPPKSGAHVPQHLMNIAYEMLQWRTSSSFGFLEETVSPSGSSSAGFRLKANVAHSQLESTEKGQVSCAIGAMFASAFAKSLAPSGFPYVVHVSWAEAYGHLQFKQKRGVRPDYVAYDSNGNFILLESKGRSGSSNWRSVQGDLRKKRQASAQLVGASPVMEVGCATQICTDGKLQFFGVDPSSDPKPIERPDKMIEDYEASVKELIDLLEYGEKRRSMLRGARALRTIALSVPTTVRSEGEGRENELDRDRYIVELSTAFDIPYVKALYYVGDKGGDISGDVARLQRNNGVPKWRRSYASVFKVVGRQAKFGGSSQ